MNITKREYISSGRIEMAANAFRDFNPIHLEPAAVEDTPFDRPIAHGMLIGGIIGSHLVEIFGEGTVWLEQTLKFSAPVYENSYIDVVYSGIVQSSRRVQFTVTVIDDNGNVCVSGAGTGLVKKDA